MARGGRKAAVSTQTLTRHASIPAFVRRVIGRPLRRPPEVAGEMVALAVAREWARKAFQDGKDAGYNEAVKSLERSVEQLVRLGVQTQRK